MRKLRRINAFDVPYSVRPIKGPRTKIFARTKEGRIYFDSKDSWGIATTTAWFGWTTEPEPFVVRELRRADNV